MTWTAPIVPATERTEVLAAVSDGRKVVVFLYLLLQVILYGRTAGVGHRPLGCVVLLSTLLSPLVGILDDGKSFGGRRVCRRECRLLGEHINHPLYHPAPTPCAHCPGTPPPRGRSVPIS